MELDILFSLSISLFLCLISSKVMKLIHMPNVTGYLIIGLLVGPYCLNIISLETVEQLSIVSNIALGFIAFSIGAEFKLDYLKKVGRAPVVIDFTEALGAVLLVDLILMLTGNNIAFSLVLGAIASATAPAATLMVVRQYKAKGPVTNTLLPVVAIDDAVALMAFGVSVAIAKLFTSSNSGFLLNTLINPVVEIVGALVIGSILGIIISFLTKWFTGRGNRLSISIAIILLCISLSDRFGFSSLLACMAMGAFYVNLSKVSNKVFELIDRFTPPIFMLFFFLSGAGLNLSILPSVGFVGLLYIVSRVVGKVLGAGFGAKICNSDPVIKKYLGYTLIPQAGVAIGLANVAMTVVPDYGEQIRTIILCATVIYELVGPIATKLSLKKAGEILM